MGELVQREPPQLGWNRGGAMSTKHVYFQVKKHAHNVNVNPVHVLIV